MGEKIGERVIEAIPNGQYEAGEEQANMGVPVYPLMDATIEDTFVKRGPDGDIIETYTALRSAVIRDTGVLCNQLREDIRAEIEACPAPKQLSLSLGEISGIQNANLGQAIEASSNFNDFSASPEEIAEIPITHNDRYETFLEREIREGYAERDQRVEEQESIIRGTAEQFVLPLGKGLGVGLEANTATLDDAADFLDSAAGLLNGNLDSRNLVPDQISQLQVGTLQQKGPSNRETGRNNSGLTAGIRITRDF